MEMSAAGSYWSSMFPALTSQPEGMSTATIGVVVSFIAARKDVNGALDGGLYEKPVPAMSDVRIRGELTKETVKDDVGGREGTLERHELRVGSSREGRFRRGRRGDERKLEVLTLQLETGVVGVLPLLDRA